MKCDRCEGRTRIKKGQRYHYAESGLDNVYLENIEIRLCEYCGAISPRLPRINDLHATIGRAMALKETALSGAEARYLRKSLGLTAREWAAFLRIDSSTLSRWENDEQMIGPQSDSLIRMLYFYLLAEKEGTPIPEKLAERLATIVERSSDALAVLINPKKPAEYSYVPEGELTRV